VVEKLNDQAPDLALTADAVENRGFEYHTGITFTLFARGVRGELGSGGRYVAGNGDDGGEPATGFTLFMDSVLRALPAPNDDERIYVPACSDGAALRAEGRTTVQGLDDGTDGEAEARRLQCTHILVGGEVRPIEA
jgi:ATP phosphoribosyltransferase regulatory subunit